MSDMAGRSEDPLTAVGGTQSIPSTGKGMKKKKKRKVSAAEKAMAKLEKQADELRKSGQPFTSFLNRMDSWLKKNAQQAIELFKRVDLDGESVVTFEEFKAGLMDLNVPCNAVELHLLCQLFDKYENEEVDLLDISKGMAVAREQEEAYTMEDYRPSLQLTDRSLNKCPRCRIAVWDGQPYKHHLLRYVHATVRLVTFDSLKVHPSHFSGIVHSHITVQGLMGLVAETTQLHTTQMAIFTDKSREVKAMLLPHKSLEEYNYRGGSKEHPEEILLYYDYKVEFKDCPLLMCDFYFGQNIKI